MFWLAACTEAGPADPRPTIQKAFTTRPAARPPAAALLADQPREACEGFKSAVVLAEGERAWIGLVTAAARGEGCLSEADGDALCAWSLDRPAWRDACAEWSAARGRPVDGGGLGPAAKLRLAMRGSDRAEVIAAASAALAMEKGDVAACRVLIADAMDRNDAAEVHALAGCSQAADVQRMRAEMLDREGRYEEAVAAYLEAGSKIHAAAILYQSVEGGRARAEELLGDDPAPPAALHRAWMGGSREGLDDSPEATIARALAGDETADVSRLPGPQAAVVAARLGDLSALDRAIEAAPFAEPVLRANVVLRKGDREALTLWKGRDPDHVRLAGTQLDRDMPWTAIAPWPLREPMTGSDAIGEEWRAAAALSGADRQEALDALQAEHPELDGLPGARWALEHPAVLDAGRPVR